MQCQYARRERTLGLDHAWHGAIDRLATGYATGFVALGGRLRRRSKPIQRSQLIHAIGTAGHVDRIVHRHSRWHERRRRLHKHGQSQGSLYAACNEYGDEQGAHALCNRVDHITTVSATGTLNPLAKVEELTVAEAPSPPPGSVAAKDLIVIARKLRKSFRMGKEDHAVLDGVDMWVMRGEFVAIMGPSGCGKTTLLNCLSGLDDFDQGWVVVDGKEVGALTDADRTRHRAERMGFVFQNFNLIPVLTAAQNVEMPLLMLGWQRREARRRALQVLEVVGLANYARHKPSELSGGQQQRVAIARALVNNPAIVWADEPTGNLDRTSGKIVLKVLRWLNERRQVTIVVVTHDPEVARMADRVIHMDSGRVVGIERPPPVTQ